MIVPVIRGGASVSAEVIWLRDRLVDAEPELDIDLTTAVDVALRDLAEIERYWGTDRARERLSECRELLLSALEGEAAPLPR